MTTDFKSSLSWQKFADRFFCCCRSTLSAKVSKFRPPPLASQKRIKNVNQVVGQCCLPKTKFAVDGNSSPYASNWKLSARGHNLAHLT